MFIIIIVVTRVVSHTHISFVDRSFSVAGSRVEHIGVICPTGQELQTFQVITI